MSSISCVPAANAAMLFCAQLDKSSFWSSDFIHWSRRKWGIFSVGQTSRLNKFNIKNDKLINHHHFYLYSLKQQRSGIILLEIKQADFETKLGRCTHFVLSNSEIFFCPALHWNMKYLALKYEISCIEIWNMFQPEISLFKHQFSPPSRIPEFIVYTNQKIYGEMFALHFKLLLTWALATIF